jgi:hypothetical protein
LFFGRETQSERERERERERTHTYAHTHTKKKSERDSSYPEIGFPQNLFSSGFEFMSLGWPPSGWFCEIKILTINKRKQNQQKEA